MNISPKRFQVEHLALGAGASASPHYRVFKITGSNKEKTQGSRGESAPFLSIRSQLSFSPKILQGHGLVSLVPY
jgi:hypothetical protein